MSTFRYPLLAFAAIAVMAVAIPACDAILSPCRQISGYDLLNFMDGTWSLNSVDGKPFTGSFVLPDGGKLLKANMDFSTRNLKTGSCDKPGNSGGEVIALFQVSNTQNVVQHSKVQVGSFEYVNQTKTVTLRALGKSADGTAQLNFDPVHDNSTMRIAAKIPLSTGLGFDLGSITYNLTFTRQPFKD